MSDFLQNYFFYLVLILFAIVSWFYFQRKKVWFRKVTSKIIIRIPFFGGLIKQIYLARFYQFMYLLTNAKHNLVQSVGLVKNVIGFYPIEMALDKTEEDLRKGEFLHSSLDKSGFFDTRLVTLVKVAENSNQLDKMFEKLSIQEQESLEIKTETMGSIIEPIMIILIGLLVVVILIAMYLPLFNLSNVI
jgi:type IV pilus assembly protein PilC